MAGMEDAFRKPIRLAIAVSLALNISALVSPLYMTQIYDRVMSSRSIETLVAITLVTLVAIGLFSLLDLFRNIVFARASATLYAELEARVLAGCRQIALAGATGRRARPIDDLEIVRSFFLSPVPGALFDLLFVPLFLIVLFIIHPLIGAFTVAISAVLVVLALVNRRVMMVSSDRAVTHMREATDAAEAYLRSVEPAMAMGYAVRGERRAAEANRKGVLSQVEASVSTGWITATIKGVRQASQILIMGVAAWLALEDAISAGSIIACSILFGKAQGPIDQVVGAWRQVFQVRGAWSRIQEVMIRVPETNTPMELPMPKGALSAEAVTAMAPDGTNPILKGLTFDIKAGEAIGIVGPSGSGKSTLARVLLGVWPVRQGVVRLDGADIAKLDMSRVGTVLGYVPQQVELLPGTIAENIRRLGPDDAEGVVAAAMLAGAHEMILGLPHGYDTVIGERGFGLSGGQRQRIGLARALYGSPSLVVLDEPDTGLDRDGELALVRAVAELRERGATVVLIAHKPSLVQGLDKLLVLNDGRLQKFGPVAEILGQITPSIPRAVNA